MVIKASAHETVYLNLEIPPTAKVVKVRLPRSCYGAKIRPKCIPKSVTELDLFDSRIIDVPAGVIGKYTAKLRLCRLTPRIVVPVTVSDIFLENWPRDTSRLESFERIFIHVSENESIRGIGEHWVYSEDYADVVDLGDATYRAEDPIEIKAFGLRFYATKRLAISPIEPWVRHASVSHQATTAVGGRFVHRQLVEPLILATEPIDTQLPIITSEILNQWTVTSKQIGEATLARDIEDVMTSAVDTLKKARDFGILHREPIFRIVIREYSDARAIVAALKERLPTDLLEITDTVVKEGGTNMRAIEINSKWITQTDSKETGPQTSPKATRALPANLLPRAASADCSSMYV